MVYLSSDNGQQIVSASLQKSTLICDRKAEQARIDSIIIRSNLMRRIHQLRDTTLTLAAEEEIQDKMKVLEKVVKKKEK